MPAGLLSRVSWAILKPEYFADPIGFLLRRFRRRTRSRVRLHGGLEIEVVPDEMISNSLRRKGHYDLAMSEVIWRLLDPGETAIDVGGHIGYVTALMATRVGPRGRVVTLEPHPELFRVLQSNVERWSAVSRITAYNLAAGETDGPSRLRVPAGWELNRGIASLAPAGDRDREGERAVEVRCTCLDELLERLDLPQVGLMKVDVEGFEAAVFRGAGTMLREQRCRDLVFEDFGGYPSEAMRILQAAGYEVFALAKGFRAPRLARPDRAGVHPRNDFNFVATHDPRRAEQRMERRGYFVLER